MMPCKYKCPLCGSPIVANPCGNPIFRTTYTVLCSNDDCRPMPSECGPTKAVIQRSVDDLLAQGITEEEAVDRLALEYILAVQERFGKVATEEEMVMKE